MDYTVHGVTKSRTQLSDFSFHFHAKSLQLCLTVCNLVDCSPLDSSVHGGSPDKITGVGCHALLQGIFPTQRSNLHLLWLLHCSRFLLLRHQGSPHLCLPVFQRIWFRIQMNSQMKRCIQQNLGGSQGQEYLTPWGFWMCHSPSMRIWSLIWKPSKSALLGFYGGFLTWGH